MVKNTECLNTTNCCVFKCSNVSNATTVFNSQRCSKGMFKIIHFVKITEKRYSLENTLNNLSDITKVALKVRKKH